MSLRIKAVRVSVSCSKIVRRLTGTGSRRRRFARSPRRDRLVAAGMDVRTGRIWALHPSSRGNREAIITDMSSADRIDDHASDLLNTARTLDKAAGEPGSYESATAALACLEEALRALSAGWYQVAADAVSGIPEGRPPGRRAGRVWPRTDDGLSREQEVRLVATLHDVAAAFARCARVCRDARPTVAPLIDRRVSAARGGGGIARVERHERLAARGVVGSPARFVPPQRRRLQPGRTAREEAFNR